VPFPSDCPSIVRSSLRFCGCTVHAQLDGESASCSPGHRAKCWSLLGALGRRLGGVQRISRPFDGLGVVVPSPLGAQNEAHDPLRVFVRGRPDWIQNDSGLPQGPAGASGAS
jgi:hypothetical protein